MQGRPILYQGKPIDSRHFRVYIYQEGGISKLVNSYEEYERYLSTGLWFSTKEELIKEEEKVLDKKEANKKPFKENPDVIETKVEKINVALSRAALADKKTSGMDIVKDK